MKNILIIVGSMRKGSYNKQLAAHIENSLEGKAKVSYLDYADLPFMNQDIEFPTPETVARVRSEIESADGLWIVSPEHNHSIPSVLKNLLDWISRPREKGNPDAGKTSADVKVTLSGIGGVSGTSFARKALYDICEFIGMNVVADQGTGLVYNRDAFNTGEISVSAEDDAKLKEQAKIFLESL
ncbi:MAG: NAD(P)H-dependent oxidoreductase [Clostridiaceae bacterium]|jgi:NAD(P)H-dependent FMN reductase|nr:NADPH-dependent FMN reductase [Bacillota bacterium]NLN51465.1 NAD(P)H-dependent oxidoreductase [Clostridiaceae bacterium]